LILLRARAINVLALLIVNAENIFIEANVPAFGDCAAAITGAFTREFFAAFKTFFTATVTSLFHQFTSRSNSNSSETHTCATTLAKY
jgi:hypothetical protein